MTCLKASGPPSPLREEELRALLASSVLPSLTSRRRLGQRLRQLVLLPWAARSRLLLHHRRALRRHGSHLRLQLGLRRDLPRSRQTLQHLPIHMHLLLSLLPPFPERPCLPRSRAGLPLTMHPPLALLHRTAMRLTLPPRLSFKAALLWHRHLRRAPVSRTRRNSPRSRVLLVPARMPRHHLQQPSRVHPRALPRRRALVPVRRNRRRSQLQRRPNIVSLPFFSILCHFPD